MSEPELTTIGLDDIEALAVGAWILGTGGGGSPYLGLLNMRRLYAEGRRVSLALADGSRIDDVQLVSAGRGKLQTLWVLAYGMDTFVPLANVVALWETAGVRSEAA